MKLSSSYFTSHKSLSGYLALWCVYPHRLHLQNRRQELYFAFAGLSGVALYYLFENITLTFSSALILQKIPTRYTILGIALTLAGLILSQRWT